jgi:Mg-chelatase subunit ChlD
MSEFTNNDIIIPDSFYCPITQTIMTDPVICPEGHTFERAAIEEWISRNPTNPITRRELQAFRLRPNRALKDSIDKIRSQIDESNLKRVTSLSQQCSKEMLETLQSSLETLTMTKSFNDRNLEVTIQVPDSTTRAPCNVVLVIDESASMGSEAIMKNDSGQNESHGFSLLDIVKQAAHAVRVCLEDHDSLAVVAYSANGRVVLPFTPMTSTGKLTAESAINQIKPTSNTNIWDGLVKAFDLCRTNSSPEKNSKILLLTDGMPNVIPPRGHVGMINKYKDTHGQLPATVDTFGFGYSLDTKDLGNIALESLGNYCFIPDSSMVGDIFSNAVANILSMAISNSQLSIALPDGIQFNENAIMGNHSYQNTSWGISLDTGPMYYGQKKTYIFNFNSNLTPEILNGTDVNIRYQHFDKETNTIATNIDFDQNHNMIENFRLQFVENVLGAYKQMIQGQYDVAKAIIKSFSDLITSSPIKNDPFIKDLITDLTEQVTIAFAKYEDFDRWGKHYLPSLVRAHQQQVCNNFRDPGVQHYGKQLFNQMRDKADDQYNNLPAPTPTATYTSSSANVTRSALRVPTLSSYNIHSGPCFHGDCLVKMYDGTVKKVSNIRKGDKVLTNNSSQNYYDTVETVLRTVFENGRTVLVELEGGWLGTEWHPVKELVNNVWKFPCQINQGIERSCQAVYSFLLENRNTIFINNIESATFAHGLTDNSVISHPYFGCEEVVNNLMEHNGWSTGYITITPDCIQRDMETGLVNRINKLNRNLNLSY